MSEEVTENPKGELEQGEFKVKKPKVKKLTNKKATTAKIDLSKKEEVKEEKPIDKVIIKEEPVIKEEVKEEVVESKEETISPISEITEEEVVEEVKAPIVEDVVERQPEIKLPENIEKLVSFMEDTGGTVEDYVRLNADYSNVDKDTLLKEYYKQTKPHLDMEEVNFLLEDNFQYDEDLDEERDIRKKKLAYKEEIAKATNFLEETKSKYYDEIKLRPGVTQEQQKAMDFFNRYNKEQQIAEQHHDNFQRSTNKLFADEFKGFEFNVGEKKFRYNVANVNDVAEKQSNLNTFVKKFLNNEGEVVDTVGYHKAIYAADNADTIASHFYEQGKADAVKDMMAKSKNISLEPRPQANGDIFINGLKVKAVNGVDSSKLKFKIKK